MPCKSFLSHFSPTPCYRSNLSRQLLIDRKLLDDYIFMLTKRKQMILFGPPGTGKTYVAQQLANYFVANNGDGKGEVTIVQFHPNYSYEDFVEGYRPVSSSPNTFELVEGPFKKLAIKA